MGLVRSRCDLGMGLVRSRYDLGMSLDIWH